MNKLLIVISMSILFCFQLFSQETKNWHLVDMDTKSGIPFAHVIDVNNQENSTLTNNEGEFAFAINGGTIDSFFISHLSYKDIYVSLNDVIQSDTIFLTKKSVELDEIIFYDVESILKKVYENISTNYPQTTTDENYFIRYFTKQNDVKFQIVESIINIEKQSYFSSSKFSENKINLIALSSNKNEKLEDINFKPFALSELFQIADINLIINEKYNVSTKQIDKDRLKIIFNSTSDEVLKSGEFKGYLIINLSDYAILEMFYEKKYIEGGSTEDLIKGYKTEYMYKSVLRRWDIDLEMGKYTLDFMQIKDDFELTNPSKETKILFQGDYILTSIDVNVLNFDESPKKLKSKKKTLIDYKSFNSSNFDGDKVMLKTIHQQFNE